VRWRWVDLCPWFHHERAAHYGEEHRQGETM